MKDSANYNRKLNKSIIFICISFIVVISFLCGIFLGLTLIRHEQNQNARIVSLEEKISKYERDFYTSETKNVEWLDDGYNYLAIGNSITLHGTASYWWNDVGMAASNKEHDYFHIVSTFLEENNSSVMSVPYNFTIWETQSHDRDETLTFLDLYLDPKLNLVTIQLGENVSDLTTYEEDYVSLINYIKRKAPDARILVIEDFWTLKNRNDLKINAIIDTGVEYVSLEGITDNKEYYCGLGTVVYDNEGNEHIVEHSGVAIHPGDNGMQAIADKIIDVLK